MARRGQEASRPAAPGKTLGPGLIAPLCGATLRCNGAFSGYPNPNLGYRRSESVADREKSAASVPGLANAASRRTHACVLRRRAKALAARSLSVSDHSSAGAAPLPRLASRATGTLPAYGRSPRISAWSIGAFDQNTFSFAAGASTERSFHAGANTRIPIVHALLLKFNLLRSVWGTSR